MMNLFLAEIADRYIRENFVRIQRAAAGFNKMESFRHFEIVVPKQVTNFRYKHGLGFKPKDVIQTWLEGPGDLTWNYDEFDATYLDITTTGPCTVRAFIGAYREGA